MAKLTKAKYLLDSELASLNANLTKNQEADFRSTTLLWVLAHTGARASEVLAIRKCDLCFEGHTLLIRGLKDSEDRDLPLTAFLYNRLIILAQGLKDDERIFKLTWPQARNIWYMYRPVKKKLHSLRHTRAIAIYKKTKDVYLVKRVLGHKSLTSTLVYTEIEIGHEELRRALL